MQRAQASSDAWMSWESPAWTRGLWVSAPDGDAFPPPYTRQQCGDVGRELDERDLRRFATNVSARWQPLSGAQDPWTLPTAEELHARVRDRSFVYAGDSLARNQFSSLLAMLFCDHRFDHNERDATRTFLIPELGTRLAFLASNWLVAEDRTANTGESWFIDDRGTKTPMKRQDHKVTIHLDQLAVHPSFSSWAGKANVTWIVNFGHWLRRGRSDVALSLGNGRVAISATEVAEAIGRIAAFAAGWFEEHLGRGSIAIWHGYSPGKGDRLVCEPGEMHGVTKAIRGGLAEVLSRRGPGPQKQFFVDIGCLVTSAPRSVFYDEMHFHLPGLPDVENLFVLKKLEDLGLSGPSV